MRECSSCGIPRMFTRFFEWRSNGTLIGTGRARFPVTLIESGEFENLFDGLSSTIGTSIDRFMIQAQKDMGKALYDRLPIRHLKLVPANRFTRPQWLAKLTISIVSRNISIFGDGRVSLDHYQVGESAVIRLKNYCLVPMLVGSAMGVYEALEEMPDSEADFSIEEGDLVIRLTHAAEKPVSESRLHLETVRPGTGPLSYRRCARCDAPLLAAQTFSWDLGEGIITNRETGARDVILSVPSVNAVFRELEKEIGEEMAELIFDTQRKLTAQRLESVNVEDPEVFWERYLTEMGLRGLGYPRLFEVKGDSISVEMQNAYNQDLYAARLAGALERITGQKSAIVWEKREPSSATYSIGSEVSLAVD